MPAKAVDGAVAQDLVPALPHPRSARRWQARTLTIARWKARRREVVPCPRCVVGAVVDDVVGAVDDVIQLLRRWYWAACTAQDCLPGR
eukprot:12092919-Heterocapsa_arctica.AAC.1